jgi:carbon storage regulator
MLVISRKIAETIRIGPDITIEVVRLSSNKVRIGVTAPTDTPIWRGELVFEGEELPASLAAPSS